MDKDFLINILENIDMPIAVTDENNNTVFKNKLFVGDDILNNNIQEKEFEFDGKKYKLLTIENCQAHQDFISTVSHELRTPLTSIRGFADTMLIASDKLSKEQQNKFLSIIRNQADRLTRLVENLLEISSLSNFISPLITMFEKKYPNQKYKTEISKQLPYIWSDSDILEQIMTNLIDNASKYSPEHSEIKINASFYDDKILIKIIDEAEKIPENKFDDIFKKFSRIDNTLTRKTEGSGLGLFITKSLTEKMHGTIEVTNYEKGNIFVLTLPSANIENQINEKMSGDKS